MTEDKKRRPFLNVEGAAEYLTMSRHTVYEYTESGKITHYKLGGRLRFDPADLDAFLEQRRVPAISE